MLKRLPGMQMLNPVSYVTDRAPATAELWISQTSVCCNDFYSTLSRVSYFLSVFNGALDISVTYTGTFFIQLNWPQNLLQISALPLKVIFSRICIGECDL